MRTFHNTMATAIAATLMLSAADAALAQDDRQFRFLYALPADGGFYLTQVFKECDSDEQDDALSAEFRQHIEARYGKIKGSADWGSKCGESEGYVQHLRDEQIRMSHSGQAIDFAPVCRPLVATSTPAATRAAPPEPVNSAAPTQAAGIILGGEAPPPGPDAKHEPDPRAGRSSPTREPTAPPVEPAASAPEKPKCRQVRKSGREDYPVGFRADRIQAESRMRERIALACSTPSGGGYTLTSGPTCTSRAVESTVTGEGCESWGCKASYVCTHGEQVCPAGAGRGSSQ